MTKLLLMRLSFNILLCATFISCSHQEINNNLNLSINACVIRSYDTILWDTGSKKIYDVRLSIINKSLHPISFWMMTCSWEESFIINNDYTWFLGHDCNSNVPWPHHLNSGDSLVQNSSIIQENGSRYRRVETTIFGLIYIDSSNCRSYGQFDSINGDKSKWDRIIWSNPLYLNDFK